MLHDIITDTTAGSQPCLPGAGSGGYSPPGTGSRLQPDGRGCAGYDGATASGSAARERDALMPVTWAEGVIFYAIAGGVGTCIPAVPDLCRHAGRLLASLGVAGDGFVSRPERHCVAVVVVAGASAVMR
jgi:hypothetical protein